MTYAASNTAQNKQGIQAAKPQEYKSRNQDAKKMKEQIYIAFVNTPFFEQL